MLLTIYAEPQEKYLCNLQGFIPMVVPDMLKGVVFVSSFFFIIITRAMN